MITFFGILAVGVLAILFILFRPLVWRSSEAYGSRQQLNASIYRDELAKLDLERKTGVIDQSSYDLSYAELRLRLSQDAAGQEDDAQLKSPWITIAALAILIPVAAAGLYSVLGSPQQSLDPQAYEQVSKKEIEQMVAGLAAKLQQEPDNLKGWAMLARSYKVLQRPVEAQQAYERAGSYVESDPQLLADYADVVATNANGNFAGKPTELLQKALKLDPNHPMSLWLIGTAAYSNADFASAIRYWEHLATLLDPASEDGQLIQGAIRDARAKSAQPAPGTSLRSADAPPAAASPDSGASLGVSGIVEVDPKLGPSIKLDDVMMIVARAPDQRMPVAVLRVRVTELPLRFSLTDAMAMTPNARISMLPSVVVEARISKSGFAQPEPGDLYSEAQTVKPGADNVRLYINQVRR